jgi:pre-mRNA-splicing helicase BRR2
LLVQVNALLQCHFSRQPLGSDLASDQKSVVRESVRLLQAIVDVISSNGWYNPALAAMELSQMVVQVSAGSRWAAGGFLAI